MKVTFLGTATSIGVPVITCKCRVCRSENPKDKRLRASIRIEVGGNTFIIDCGPDFRMEMLRENIDHIDGLIFTHGHRDHIAGLDDIRAYNYIMGKRIDIYGTKKVMDDIITEFPYIFSESYYKGAPKLNVHYITDEPFYINGVLFTPVNVLHEQMPVMGYRVGDFTYITDANQISDKELEKIKGSKVVVINALRQKKHPSHFSLAEAVEIIQNLKPEFAYITHIGHYMGLHDEVNAQLPANIQLAYDGLSFEI